MEIAVGVPSGTGGRDIVGFGTAAGVAVGVGAGMEAGEDPPQYREMAPTNMAVNNSGNTFHLNFILAIIGPITRFSSD